VHESLPAGHRQAQAGARVARRRPPRWLAAFAICAALVAGCTQLREFLVPNPGVPAEWAAFVDDVRAYERRIGFTPTGNFLDLSEDHEGYPFCGYSAALALPYSYEDPAIRWHTTLSEQDCRSMAAGGDMFFDTVEAVGEIGTPVTPSMVGSKLDRFLYLVIHEDCHDQFDLPYGIEEPLCNLITYKAMAAFSEEKFGARAREDRAIRRYADLESRRTRAAIDYYGQVAALYARYDGKQLSADAALKARAAIFANAERALGRRRAEMNNVRLANEMTYSRHYPFLEGVYDALGRDLARTVAFFKTVDRMKPTRAAVMKQHRLANEKSVEFLRLYEAAVMDTARRLLAAEGLQPPR